MIPTSTKSSEPPETSSASNPRLLTLDEPRTPNADLDSDTDLIRNYVTGLVDAAREVMVLMHSYGGQVRTNALAGLGVQHRQQNGLSGGVTKLVYLSAFALKEGTSMVNVVERFGHTDLIPLGMDNAEDKSCANRDPLGLLLGPGLTPHEEGYSRRLKRWNVTVMYQAVDAAAWRVIPVSYIQTTEAMSPPIDYQKWMIGEMRAEGRDVQTFELKTGHCCMITMVNETVAIVKVIVENDQVG